MGDGKGPVPGEEAVPKEAERRADGMEAATRTGRFRVCRNECPITWALFSVCVGRGGLVFILTTMSVWLALRQGLQWVQRSLRKGTAWAWRTRLSASCTLVVGVWKPQLVGSEMHLRVPGAR